MSKGSSNFIRSKTKRVDSEVVSVLGLGFIGVVMAIGFAEQGNKVIGMDCAKPKVDKLKRGQSHFFEPGVDSKLKEQKIKSRLEFTTDLKHALHNSNISFICVGTPPNRDRTVNLRYIRSICNDIAPLIKRKKIPHIFVSRSTVPPGTAEDLIIPILEKGSGLKEGIDFHVCSNPEFMREGCMLDDFLFAEVVVIGGHDENALNRVEAIYGKVAKRAKKCVKVNYKIAEMTKYAFNCYLVTKISFANEIGLIAQQAGVNGREVMDILTTDERIMVAKSYLKLGYAYGGSCLPKDPPALMNFSKRKGYDPIFFRSILKLNEKVFKRGVKLARDLCDGSLKGKRISILGIAFKKNTSDIRESQLIRLIRELLQHKARVSVVDPLAIGEARKVLGNKVLYPKSIEKALRRADLCILGLNYEEFNQIAKKIKLMNSPKILDLCDHSIQSRLKNLKQMGLVYKGILW